MNRREAGYTLLEMIVALVVFGLVMAGIAQSFRFGLAAWSAAGRTGTTPEDMAAVDAALSNMITQALASTIVGKQDRFAFTTRLPEAAGITGGLIDAAVRLTPDGDLVLLYKPRAAGMPLGQPAPPRVETLATGVKGLSVSYLLPQDNGAPGNWTNEAKAGAQPLLVRMHLDFDGKRQWPDLIAGPVKREQDLGLKSGG